MRSGEFTDPQRRCCVLLPPAPEPELPGMDAIRKAHAPADQPLGAEGASHRLPARSHVRKPADKSVPEPAQLETVEALQRAIVQGLKQGARFSTSDKEGGSAIVWRSGSYARSDWGDRPAQESCTEESE